MSVFEFVLVILVDVPVTLLIRRYLFSETSGVFREVLALLYGFVMGVFYVLLLKNDKTFFVVIDYGDNFYRDLIVQNVGVFIMVLFHAWSVSVRYK
ncbi:hypothetical protein [Pseudomonas entomophila]|uniref:Uncharacterized protein n=1 Tax=Pseudomonas entomophila TaxID=312306 RepID=A0ABY9QK17_9PSED|nr:hypothetical protein [Pseudomonas entomophila]WMW04393.1 hypothetical protein RAH46_18890 [Pseudomonas entomophila]